ncbi:MAG TPA: outer membrane beta-barrel protein [Longimicrobium sp.]|nr:outer membrane beta-barrel protein [Longimicrobium sp.]
MKRFVRTLALAGAIAGTLSTAAAAQAMEPGFDAAPARSNTAGFSLGVFLTGSAVRAEESDEIDSGPGGTVHLGYGINQNVSFFVRVTAAEMQPAESGGESYAMAHADLGARYSFASPAAALRPYVQAAITGRALSFDLGSEGNLEARGSGFTGAAGLEYFITPRMGLEASLSYSIGKFSEGRLGGGEWIDFEDDAFDAVSSRFDLGFSWHP